jgi:hypothetical protein
MNNYNTRDYSKELFTLINELLEKKLIVIPISDIHIIEFNKRENIQDFRSMLQFLEKLSENICFISREERWKNELLFCMQYTFGIQNDFEYLKNYLWTKPFFIEGTIFPSLDNSNPLKSREDNFLEFFLNHSWNMKLTERYSMLNEELLQKYNLKQFEVTLTEKLVKGREENKHDFKDFKELLEKEFFGTFSLLLEEINMLLDEYYITYKQGKSIITGEFYKIDKNYRAHYLGISIIKYILDSKMYWLFPSVSINAGLHSLKRWEIESKYKNNDTFDFNHAEVALPYCDYFLTERNLCGMIKNNYLKFDEVFKCNVITNPKDAIDHLSNII